VPKHSWIKRGVGAPPNRFSIKPGRHWDGVDRGTGFEQEMFKAVNDRSAKRQADWKYGQSMWE
jgi:pre-mRNA-splicing factor CWC26